MLGALGAPLSGFAQEPKKSSFEEFRNQARAGFEQFRNKSREDFEAFRKKINDDYAAFLEEAWHPTERKQTPAPPPQPKPLPPVVYEPEPQQDPEPEPKPIEIKRVIKSPTPVPPPEPVAPLAEELTPNLDLIPIKGSRPVRPKESKPKGNLSGLGGNKPNLGLSGEVRVNPTAPKPPTVAVRYLGTPLNVRWDKSAGFRLAGVSEKAVSDAWKQLSDGRADNLLRDCLELRERLELNDWAYLKLLEDIGNGVCGKDTNEGALLMAWLFCQSGYKMRLASSATRLYMLYASDHLIYNHSYFPMDGTTFYAYNCQEKNLKVSSAEFPKEQPLSLIISTEPRLASDLSEPRKLKSRRYGMELTSQTNRNLLELYNTYPTSYINGDIMTRWAMYANVPASAEFQEFVYPEMRKALEGKDKRQGAEMLLNWVQTAFPYEYDDTVWGYDRAFFADETLYYPACDCEDRSILFSRLVRDLLDLDVMLVYYPGHLATAVAFNEAEPRGDYLEYGGRIYTVCDPTYTNASTGRTMPGMDNSSAQVIPLKK